MLGISKVTIRGFQSHVDSVFSLAPGLTVITGPSDAGKTAVIRALRWLAFNEPQGDSFLHTLYNADGSLKSQAEQAEVIVELDNGVIVTKTRRKGKTTYTHSLYPEPWEKAEVPPEIKEALGLNKQTYGDNFETCLNFAFQLDPPFLLSETGSVGAKVLGKLAGTEVVDKSIGSVNKQTHRVRTDLAQAEKTIGQLDVELLEYLEVDAQYTTLVALEATFTKTEALVDRQKALVELNNQHVALTDKQRTLRDTLTPLSCVPLLTASLHNVSFYEDKRQAIDKLAADFWRYVEIRRAAGQALLQLKEVEKLRTTVSAISASAVRLETLEVLDSNYRKAETARTTASKEAEAADEVIKYKYQLFTVSKDSEQLEQLKSLSEQHQVATGALNVLHGRITALKPIDALQGKLEGVQALLEKLGTLTNLLDGYNAKHEEVEAVGEKVGILRFQITIANGELQEAWEEAGGVCPLCGQAIERGDKNCTH